MLFNAMKTQKALLVAAEPLLLATLVYLCVAPPAPESDAAVHASVLFRDHDRPTEGNPDLFAQYHHAISYSPQGVNEYPVGCKIREFGTALTAAIGVGIFRSTDGGMSWTRDHCTLADHHMFLCKHLLNVETSERLLHTTISAQKSQ